VRLGVQDFTVNLAANFTLSHYPDCAYQQQGQDADDAAYSTRAVFVRLVIAHEHRPSEISLTQ
jgi:hypothetical protein